MHYFGPRSLSQQEGPIFVFLTTLSRCQVILGPSIAIAWQSKCVVSRGLLSFTMRPKAYFLTFICCLAFVATIKAQDETAGNNNHQGTLTKNMTEIRRARLENGTSPDVNSLIGFVIILHASFGKKPSLGELEGKPSVPSSEVESFSC